MAKRIQYQPGQVNFSSLQRRSTVPSRFTEFCVKASKLNLASKATGKDNMATPHNIYNGSLSVADVEVGQNLSRSSLMSQGSVSSLPEFGKRVGSYRTLGIMGQKYFKKPESAPQDKETKIDAADDRGTQQAARIPIHPIDDSMSKAGKEPKHKSSFANTEFGFRSRRTDAFSGKANKRVPKGSKLEKDIAEGARKHIIACHIAPTARRGCPAIQKYLALRDCVSPVNKPMKYQRSEIASGVSTDYRNKNCVAKLKMTKSTLTLSTTSTGSSEMVKLPEVVGTVLQKQTGKTLHPVA